MKGAPTRRGASWTGADVKIYRSTYGLQKHNKLGPALSQNRLSSSASFFIPS